MNPKLTSLAAVIAGVFAAGQAQGNGIDPTVLAGQASFSTLGKSLTVINTPGTIINWQGFSIGAGEATHFIQQSAASSVLNRVIGPDPSVLLGTLTSNGRVFLINPSGILVGQGARIDVAGLVASTLNLSNQDFLANHLDFMVNPLAGKVESQGSIITPSGGSVYLVGSGITNSGTITSPQGSVILAAGQSVKIFDSSTPGVRVEITANNNAALNLGEILAQSGQVGIYGAALRNSGVIDANQVVRDASGKIVLRANKDVILEASSRLSVNGEQAGTVLVQSEAGTTLVSGAIEAKATGLGQTGGIVQMLGDKIGLLDGYIDASGDAGGGTVLIGGDYQGKNSLVQNALATYMSGNFSIAADAITNGSGGKVVLWANDSTRAYGNITARGGAQGGAGGLIETSGHWLDVANITVNASAPNGKGGIWLLDPADVTISNAVDGGGTYAGSAPSIFSPDSAANTANVNAANLLAVLNGGTDVTVTTTNFGTPGTAPLGGDIMVNAALTWSTAKTLTLLAEHDVVVKMSMTASTGGSGIVLTAGNDVLLDSNGGLNTGMTASGTGSRILLTAGNNVTTAVPITASAANTLISMNGGNNVTSTSAITASGTGAKVGMIAGGNGNVSVGVITADGGGSIDLRANKDVILNDIIGADNGNVTLHADNDGSGPGAAGGTVTFNGGSVVASINTIIRFNPATYAATSAEIFAYDPLVTGILDAKAWVFAQGNSRVYEGTDAATLSFKGTPTDGGVVTLVDPGSGATFSDKNVALGKTVTYSGFTLGGGDSGKFSLFGDGSGTTLADITARALTVTATGTNKVYDGLTTDAVTLADNRVAGDVLTVANTAANFTDKNVANGKTVNVTGISVTNTDAGNYTFNTSAVTTADITPAPLGIAANSVSRAYGIANPTFSATYTGFQGGETAAALTGGLVSVTPAIPASNIGNYVITPSGQSSTNYSITYFNGALTVTPAALVVIADAKSKIVGTSDPALTFGVTGIVNNALLGVTDTVATILSGAITRVAGETVSGGPYAITQGSLAAGSNYALSFVPNHLIIIGAAAEQVLDFSAEQVVFSDVVNNETYYRPGNFWHISLNPNNADPGFDVMRGTSDLDSRASRRLNSCSSVFGGGFCETWFFPQQREKAGAQ